MSSGVGREDEAQPGRLRLLLALKGNVVVKEFGALQKTFNFFVLLLLLLLPCGIRGECRSAFRPFVYGVVTLYTARDSAKFGVCARQRSKVGFICPLNAF